MLELKKEGHAVRTVGARPGMPLDGLPLPIQLSERRRRLLRLFYHEGGVSDGLDLIDRNFPVTICLYPGNELDILQLQPGQIDFYPLVDQPVFPRWLPI